VTIAMVRFLLKVLLLQQKVLAMRHDFHRLLVATKMLTAKLHSCYAGGRSRTFNLQLRNPAWKHWSWFSAKRL